MITRAPVVDYGAVVLWQDVFLGYGGSAREDGQAEQPSRALRRHAEQRHSLVAAHTHHQHLHRTSASRSLGVRVVA